MRFANLPIRLMGLLCLSGLSACGGSDSPSVSAVPAPGGLSYWSPQTYQAGSAIAPLTPTVTGSVSTYGVSPGLPAGLTLNAATGLISGTPTMPAATASYNITAQNASGTASFNLSITVNDSATFSLEPATDAVIGTGQTINVFATLKSSNADPYPAYVDAAQITWTSSQPGFAVINGSGLVTGVNEGTTTITAQYGTFSRQLVVHVAGTFTQRTVSVVGQGTRRHSIYTPAFGNDVGTHPLLLSLHGGGGTAMIQASTSQLPKLGAEQKVYVAFLEGTGAIQTFNAGSCCGSAQTQNVDDVRYVSTVLDDIEAAYNVNSAKVFATGFSNGAMMTHRLACALSNRLAAVAALSGGAAEFDKGLHQYFVCNPARPIPVLHMHATNDRNYPFAGGVGDGLSATDFYPIDSTIVDWRAKNNVTIDSTVEHPDATTTCYRYSVAADASKPSAPVTLCKSDPVDVYDPLHKIVFGGGHSWPGGVRSPAAQSDVPLVNFDANDYLWKFFAQ